MHLRNFIRMATVALTVSSFGAANLRAEVKVLYVPPGETDSAIEVVHGPNLAVYDTEATPQHRLFFFIGGTGSKATNSLAIDRVFAKWGFPAVSIDYNNTVIAVSSAHSLDPTAFGRYRQAIVTGAAVSDLIKVSPENSILNRFQKLLAYLAAHDANGGWNEFLKDGRPVWSKIIVAGHSQGSGHAAYIGKNFAVDRVLMFSGPQDYMDDLKKPAPWQAGESATPPGRFYAFLSKNDPFNVHHQVANCMTLMRLANPKTLAVKPGETLQGNYQIFINDAPKNRAHGSTLSLPFTNVWNHIVREGN